MTICLVFAEVNHGKSKGPHVEVCADRSSF